MHSLPKLRLAMMSRPACGCRVTRRVSNSLKNPSAAVIVTVAAELQRGDLLTLTLRHLAASDGGHRESRLMVVQGPGTWMCCSGEAAGSVRSRRSPYETLLWPHALCSASAGDHSLVQGLKGDATYLVVTDQGEIEKYGINGVALHPALSSRRCHGSADPK